MLILYCAILASGMLFGFWQMEQHAWQETMAIENAFNDLGLTRLYASGSGYQPISKEEGRRNNHIFEVKKTAGMFLRAGSRAWVYASQLELAIKLKRDSSIPSESSFNFVKWRDNRTWRDLHDGNTPPSIKNGRSTAP